MDRNSSLYIVGFAAVVCLVCSVLVSGAAVALKDRQDENKVLDQKSKVLSVAGVLPEGKDASADEIQKLYDENVTPRLVDLTTGDFAEGDAATYDQVKATKDPATSRALERNKAQVPRVPKLGLVYQIGKGGKGGKIEMYVLPIVGKGLWSTMFGFLAVANDANTIKGITYVSHGETPGLGGEVDNLGWKALWVGRRIYDAKGNVAIQVIKGQAGPPETAPHKVDGLSGATITSNGVTFMMQLWLGADGYGPFLKKIKSGGGAS